MKQRLLTESHIFPDEICLSCYRHLSTRYPVINSRRYYSILYVSFRKRERCLPILNSLKLAYFLKVIP